MKWQRFSTAAGGSAIMLLDGAVRSNLYFTHTALLAYPRGSLSRARGGVDNQACETG